MGDNENARKYLHQAITIFDAMGKLEIVQQVTAWCKDNCEFEI